MTFDRFDQLEAYTNNSLTSEQREQLEQQLATDATFRADLTDYQQFRHSLEAIVLQQQLEQIHTELDRQGVLASQSLAEPASRVRRLWPVWATAAIMVLVAGIGLYWSTRTTLSERTFEAYYKPEPIARGAYDCGPALAPSIRSYRAGDYPKAYAEVEKLAVDQPCVHYYRGLVQLALGNASVAIMELEQAVLHPPIKPDLTYLKAEWYLALAHLKANNRDKAYQLLQKINNRPDQPFRNEARKVLRDLDHV